MVKQILPSTFPRPLGLLALASFFALGCNLAGVAQNEPPPAPPVREQHIEACATANATAELEMVDKVAAEFHEMVTCGALSSGFAFAAVEMLVNVATNKGVSPNGFGYQGAGLYGAGAAMGLQLRLGHDTSFGKAGDVLPFDLFDTSQYFSAINLSAKVTSGVSLSLGGGAESHTSGSITVNSITAPGPALELFGIDPAKLGATYDVKTLAEAMGSAVTFGLEINQGEIFNTEGITYHLAVPPKNISAMYDGDPLIYDMVSFQATKGAQTAKLESWLVSYASGHGGYLDGTIVMRVDGEFTYYVKYVYRRNLEPDIFITCDAPAPSP